MDKFVVFFDVPYILSLQRYFATMPGVLEWARDALRPAMVPGAVPEAGWRLAAEFRLSPAPPSTLRRSGRCFL